MTTDLIDHDSAAYFRDNLEAQTDLLADAAAEGDAHYIAHANGVIVKARGMTRSKSKPA